MGPCKKYVTPKIGIFDPPSPHVTLCQVFSQTPSPPGKHYEHFQVNLRTLPRGEWHTFYVRQWVAISHIESKNNNSLYYYFSCSKRCVKRSRCLNTNCDMHEHHLESALSKLNLHEKTDEEQHESGFDSQDYSEGNCTDNQSDEGEKDIEWQLFVQYQTFCRCPLPYLTVWSREGGMLHY